MKRFRTFERVAIWVHDLQCNTSVLVHATNDGEGGNAAGSGSCERAAVAVKLLTAVGTQGSGKVVHDRVDLLLTRAAFQVEHFVPVELKGIFVKVELEGNVRGVACSRGPVVMDTSFHGEGAVPSLAFRTIPPLALVPLGVVGAADGVAAMVARAVDSGVTSQTI